MNKLTNEHFKNIFPYDKPRNNQREIIEKIINAYNSGKKYVILSAPTGTGKSCIGYSVARHFGSGYILTSQKILQQQYYDDFKIPMVLGRSNYTCLKNSTLTCDMGACLRNSNRRCTSGGAITCPYIVARTKCLDSNFSNINYSYFLAASNIEGLLPKREMIICDEAHTLEDELIKLYTVKISESLIKFVGCSDLKLPKEDEKYETKCRWLCVDFFEHIKSQFLFLKNQLSKLNGLKSTKEYKKIYNKHAVLERLIIQITAISKMLKKDQKIIISGNNGELEYKMLHCNLIFKDVMEQYSNCFLFMSATILDYKSFIENIGIDENLVEFIECDSTFPIKNRLIHYNPIGSMSFKKKQETLPKMIKAIDKILKLNKNVKGIIHTVNYDIAEKIIEGLKFSDQSYRLLMPKGADKQIILNTFYNSSKPYILISPSLMEGIDLKEDLSRLCIICKIPYANLGDKWIKVRMEESKKWYIDKACTYLVQMTGRSIRSETDFASTYILDSDFIKLVQQSIDVFPKWWQESVVVDNTIHFI